MKPTTLNTLDELVDRVKGLVDHRRDKVYNLSFPIEVQCSGYVTTRNFTWLCQSNTKICFAYIEGESKKSRVSMKIEPPEEGVVILKPKKYLIQTISTLAIVQPSEPDYKNIPSDGCEVSDYNLKEMTNLKPQHNPPIEGLRAAFIMGYKIIGYDNDQMKELLKWRIEQEQKVIDSLKKLMQ